MALKQESVLFQNGFDIGIGVAMATGSPMALGAVGDVTPPQVGSGGSGVFTFNRVDSTEALSNELGIGADVSAGIGLFSGSLSLDFSRKCKVQASSLCVMVSAREEFVFQQMDSPTLSEPAGRLVESGNMIQFAQQFGEYFVRGIQTGGRFIGVVRIETRSVESKTDVDAQLSGSYGITMSADVRFKLREALVRANAKAEAFIIFDGGRPTTRPVSNDPIVLLEQLYKAMDEWTATVRTEPKAFSVTLAPYIIALGPQPPNIAQLEKQRDVLIRCAKLRSRILDDLNLVDYVLDSRHTQEFDMVPPPQGPDLATLQASLARDLDVIAETASFAINNIKEACQPEDFMRDVKQVPGFALTAMPAMPRHTGPTELVPPPPPSIRVPNFVGLLGVELDGMVRSFSMGCTIDQILVGTCPPPQEGDLPQPSPWSREVLEFMLLTRDHQVTVVPDQQDQDGSLEIRVQSPAAGTFVSPGAVVALTLGPTTE